MNDCQASLGDAAASSLIRLRGDTGYGKKAELRGIKIRGELRMAHEGEPKIVAENTHQPSQKEWHRPGLRRLPIAATASSGKATVAGNDGGGGGKGDVSILHS
jgi:hypothetical protein